MSDHTENCISPNGICNVSLLQEIIDSNIAPIVENLAAATDVCNFTPATKLDEAPESLEMPAETVYINEIDEITTVGNNAVNSFPDSRDFGAPPSDDLMKIEVVLEENDEMEAEESAPTEPDVIAEEPSGHILLDAERSHKKFVSAPEAQIEPEVLPELEEEEYGMKPTVAFLDLYSEVKRKEALNYVSFWPESLVLFHAMRETVLC